jgi:hypothetical protein
VIGVGFASCMGVPLSVSQKIHSVLSLYTSGSTSMEDMVIISTGPIFIFRV